MIGAREDILRSVRENLAASTPFDAMHEAHHGGYSIPEIFYPSSLLSADDLAEMFRENLTSIGGNCWVGNRKEAVELVKRILADSGAKRIAVSDSDLVQKLKSDIGGVEFVENASKEELFGCDLGVTGAQWGIAETGALVIVSDKERNRLASLVPPVHIALLETRNIRQRMSEILAEISTEDSRAVTFITGPSRTSDIELTLAIGVHGPAELHVIIIND